GTAATSALPCFPARRSSDLQSGWPGGGPPCPRNRRRHCDPVPLRHVRVQHRLARGIRSDLRAVGSALRRPPQRRAMVVIGPDRVISRKVEAPMTENHEAAPCSSVRTNATPRTMLTNFSRAAHLAV